MAVVVAEYLGVRTDTDIPIQPIRISKERTDIHKPDLKCPFRNSTCAKAKRGDKPICSLRDADSDEVWIVCSHRFCATSPKAEPLNDYQASTLHAIAKVLYGADIRADEVLVKREVPITVTADSDYYADYVMYRKNPAHGNSLNQDKPIVLEMQGGGETTNTGRLTTHVNEWELAGAVNNGLLLQPVREVSPLETNAWRRQQEQFLVKGNVAINSGGRMAFCVGTMIYDYLQLRLREGALPDLRNANWTLAFLGISEDKSNPVLPSSAPSSIPLKIDETRMLFTNYTTFSQMLTNQPAPHSASLFSGQYIDLLGNEEVI